MTGPDAEIGSVADLRERVREIGADERDPSRVTDKLLAELTEPELVVAARPALQDYVRHVLAPATGRKGPSPSGPSVARYRTKDGQVTASPKVAALRDYYAAERPEAR